MANGIFHHLGSGSVAAILALLVVLPSLVLGLGQPSTGFNETLGANVDGIVVRDASWLVRTNMSFSSGEAFHVNVTSTTVDWKANALGGGRLELLLLDYTGTTVIGPSTFWEYAQGPARYLANMTLTGLNPDWFYLRIRIDDTVRVIEARVAIAVGQVVIPHSIETFTDGTFSQPSEVFTSTSTVWVRIVGGTGGFPGQWNLYDYQRNSVVGGAQGGFSNFNRNGNVYTFSIDLSAFGPYTQGWFYTLEVNLGNAGFANGKQLEILDPTVTITRSDLAPARVFQGQTAVPMLDLHLSLSAGWATTNGPASFNLERLQLTRTGTLGANADIIGIRIYQDTNGNGIIDTDEPLILSTVSLAGLGSPTWVGTTGQAMAYLTPSRALHLLIAYDISPSATLGDLQGVSLAASTDVNFQGTLTVTGPPLASSNTQVAGATITTVTNAASAPGFVSQGQGNVAMDRLTLWTNGPTVSLTSLTVTLAGSGNINDVSSVRLYRDDGDRIFNPSLDTAISISQAFQISGTITFSSLSETLSTTPKDIWIVYTISPSAGIGHLVGSTMASNTSLAVSQGWVLNEGFPLSSGLSTVQGPLLMIVAQDLLRSLSQVPQGRTNLPVLSLNLTASASTITVTALRVVRSGSTTDADIPTARLWLDTNRNGVWDSGDALLGSQSFATGVVTFSGLSLGVISGSYRLLFLTVDVSASAVTGRTLNFRIANPSYVTVISPAVVDPTPFAITSSTVSVTTAPVVSLSNAGSAPATVFQGQVGVPMDLLSLTTNGPTIYLSSVTVSLTGSGIVADVSSVRLYRDNGDGTFNPSSDVLIATPQAFQPSGTAIFSRLSVALGATPADLWVVFDIAPAAGVGHTVEATVVSNTSLVVSQGWVLNQGFPKASGQSIVQGPALLIAKGDLLGAVPQVSQGKSNLPVLALNLTSSAGGVTLTALRVDRLGSATDLEVPTVKLWRDANHNGILDLGDTLLASQASVAGSATFTNLNLLIPSSGYRLLFLAVDVSALASPAHTLGLTLANPSYVTVAAPATVYGKPFAVSSSTASIALASNPAATLTFVQVDLVGQGLTLPMGETRTALLRLTLSVNSNTATLTDLRVDRLGTASDTDIPIVSLWRDTNGNGQLDTSSDALLGSKTFQGGIAVFSGLGLAVSAGVPMDLFLSVDVPTTATAGATVGLSVKSVDSLALAPPAAVGGTIFPLASSLATVETVYGGGNSGQTIGYLALGLGIVVAAIGLLFFLLKRRKRCSVCHGPVALGQEICDKCKENGPGVRGMSPPPPPPAR